MNTVGADTVVPNMPTVAVVIPVYNGGESFCRCLASIAQSQTQPDELIVVADGDSDESWQVAQAFGAQVIRLPRNGGPAKARNAGAQAARSDILFFVDADVTLHADTITQVRQQFLRSPDLAALIGSYDSEPGASNFLSQYKNLFHHYTHQVSSEMASTFWGACGAVRRSVFNAIQGFDERYRKACIEDIELGYRLRQQGYAIRLCKDIQVKHLKHWQVYSLLRAEIFYRALPWSRLLLQNQQFKADLNLDYASRCSVVLVYLLVSSFIVSVWQPHWLFLSAGLVLGLVLLNRRLYRFFIRQRGWWFTLQVIPWHWFYFFYGGAAFAYSAAIHHFQRSRKLIFSSANELRQSS